MNDINNTRPAVVADDVPADDANRLHGEAYGVDWVYAGNRNDPDGRDRLTAAAPDLLEACQTFAEWLRRESADTSGEPWHTKRGTPEGEAAWREWYYENLRICDLAQEQVRAAIAKATGAPA